MTPAAATVLAAAVAGAVSILVAIINAWLGRGGRRADITEKITSSAGSLLDQLQEETAAAKAGCERCESQLKRVFRVLRTLLLAMEQNDPVAVSAAKEQAWALVND